jgi:hypothetical protein
MFVEAVDPTRASTTRTPIILHGVVSAAYSAHCSCPDRSIPCNVRSPLSAWPSARSRSLREVATHKPYSTYATIRVNANVADKSKTTSRNIGGVELATLGGRLLQTLRFLRPRQGLEQRNKCVQIEGDVQPRREGRRRLGRHIEREMDEWWRAVEMGAWSLLYISERALLHIINSP